MYHPINGRFDACRAYLGLKCFLLYKKVPSTAGHMQQLLLGPKCFLLYETRSELLDVSRGCCDPAKNNVRIYTNESSTS
jgi:hypothetical protein